MNLTRSLEKNINILNGALKNEEELKEILKRRFTKKEYKVYFAFEEGVSLEEVKSLVNEDEKRVEELFTQACWKLNQEKIKNELIKRVEN